MTITERRNRAIEWLEDIYQDYLYAAHRYYVFWEVNKMFDNPKLKGLDWTFPAWMYDVYTDSIALAVRRQVETAKYLSGKSKDVVSLHALLEEFQAYPEIVDREHYKTFFEAEEKERADEEFDKWVGVGETHVVQAVVEEEIKELEKVSDIIRRYVNHNIAHKAQKKTKIDPSHLDVDKSFMVIADLITKYYLLMKGGSIRPGKPDMDSPLAFLFREPTSEELMLIPTLMGDWKAVFRVPWLEE